jgi:hypothetical protein
MDPHAYSDSYINDNIDNNNDNLLSEGKVLTDIYKIYAKESIRKDEDKILLNSNACLQFCHNKELRDKLTEMVTIFNKKLVMEICDANFNNFSASDMSKLGIAYDLNLSYCDISLDAGAFKNVHKLNLEGCSNLTSIDELNSVHTLLLDECEDLINVDGLGLGTIHELCLSGCYQITDVHTLGYATCSMKSYNYL